MKDLKSNTITPDIPTPARLTSDEFIIRPARLFEGYRIGTICAVSFLALCAVLLFLTFAAYILRHPIDQVSVAQGRSSLRRL